MTKINLERYMLYTTEVRWHTRNAKLEPICTRGHHLIIDNESRFKIEVYTRILRNSNDVMKGK